MTNEERDRLLNEIEQIRTSIERLEPEIHDQEARFASAIENGRAMLTRPSQGLGTRHGAAARRRHGITHFQGSESHREGTI